MTGIWLVINHKAADISKRYVAFTSPLVAKSYAQSIGWKDELGSFDEDPAVTSTHLNGNIHVTITVVVVKNNEQLA